MKIVLKENLNKIIAGDVDEGGCEDIIQDLLTGWGDDEGNLIIQDEIYNFWEQKEGYEHYSACLDENAIEEFTEEKN